MQDGGAAPMFAARVWARRWDCLVGLVVLVLFFPKYLSGVGAGLDPSWQLGLAWAKQLGLQFGPDIDFTYGPLGYSLGAVPLDASVVVGGFLLSLAGGALFLVAARYVTAGTGFVLSWLTTTCAFALVGIMTFNVWPLAVALVGLAAMTAARDRRRDAIMLGGLGVAAGFALLAKFNGGVFCVLAALIVMAGIARTPRTLAAGPVGVAAGILVGWISQGQNLLDFGVWLRYSVEIAVGYRSAMGVAGPPGDEGWTLGGTVAVALAVLTVIVGAILAWRSNGTPSNRPCIAGLVALFVMLAVLSGITRYGPGHTITTLVVPTAALALVLVGASAGTLPNAPPRRLQYWSLNAAVAALVFAAVALFGATVPLGVSDSLATLQRTWTLTVDAETRNAQLEASAEVIRREYGVPAPVIDALRGSRVHAEPHDISAVWAYGLDWKPAPVFQTYSAYTSGLDELNASALTSPDGPNAILRTTGPAIDGRLQTWESPDYQLTMVCNYRQTAAGGLWQALARGGSRCAGSRPIRVAKKEAGQASVVPSLPSGFVTATIDAPTPLRTRLKELVLPGRSPLMVRCDDRWYRVAQGSPTGPLLVANPAAFDWAPGLAPVQCRSIAVNRPATISFDSVPFNP